MADVDEEERARLLQARIAELEAARQLAEAADDDDQEEEVDDAEEDDEAETEENDTPEAEAAGDAANADNSDAVDALAEDLAATTQVDDGSENTEGDDEDDLEIMAVPSSPPAPPAGDDKSEEATISFEESTTTAQEAVNSQKSKREKEFEELRKLAAARKLEEGGELSAFERMKLKKQQELDALRARGGVNAANKSRFDTGHALNTDMSAFGRNQRLAAEEERRKRLEASERLKTTNALGMNSWERNQLLDKDEARRRQMEAREDLHKYRKGFEPSNSSEESPEKKPSVDAWTRVDAAHEAEKDMEKIVSKRGVSFNDAGNDVIPEPEKKKPIEEEEEPEPEPVARPSLLKVQEDAAKAHSYGLKPPTYSRVDIKFSFGLVVKNGTTDESLRDSETLRKCMNGTREILSEELPPPPDNDKIKANSAISFKIKFPQAYYDPILEPTVISIEEDTSKKPAKGKNNTRTLCKASFPVFIRDEATDEDGKNRASLALKETKATIFKALRAAVSGGKFLK
jgi:hypothetical protein